MRARIAGGAEPPYDRFHDALVDDVVRGGEFARQRFATSWRDDAGLARLVQSKRRPLDPALAEALGAMHRRLGASRASLEALDRLARGEAVCTVTGQQPGPLGGPLYALHKTASAVGLAARVEARTGVPCVPLYWMHGEDSDFAELRSVLVGDRELRAQEVSLAANSHADGELIAAIGIEPLRRVVDTALARWEGLPHCDDAAAALTEALARGADLGEATNALWLALFAERGLVVVDPRLPEFRAAARPIVERYLARAETLAESARQAGDLLESRFARRPLSGPTLDSFLFAVEDGRRRKVTPEEARRLPPDRPLSPGVALRAAIQDGVFPTVAMACGAAEVSYLAQLREVFEGVQVEPACPAPRFGATWMPPAALELEQRSGARDVDVIVAADAVLKQLSERETPAAARADLEAARRAGFEALERFADSARGVDASLPQMVDSARAKIDYQFARLLEGLVGKVRHKLERQHPEWPRLR